ncbi:MAG TPA: DUF2244 domain-containing protein [Burkholderiaceae bacterium]|nr:DUF2244 domain-containing protein [Burkholderiaceae bacterium]
MPPRVSGPQDSAQAPELRRVHWELRRNVSMSPGGLGAVLGSMVALSIVIAVWFWIAGAPFVLLFAGIELLAVGSAFIVYSRHALDGETVSFEGDDLVVQVRRSRSVTERRFKRQWVRVQEDRVRDAGLVPRYRVQLGLHADWVEVGRYLSEPRKAQFAHELRSALAATR